MSSATSILGSLAASIPVITASRTIGSDGSRRTGHVWISRPPGPAAFRIALRTTTGTGSPSGAPDVFDGTAKDGAATGAHLWADRYDRDLTDIFEVQDEVVQKIVLALAVTLTKGEQQRLRRHGTSNVEAYESWLRARALLTRGGRDSVIEARAMYRRAIELDTSFAAPHAGLALAAIADHASGWAT